MDAVFQESNVFTANSNPRSMLCGHRKSDWGCRREVVREDFLDGAVLQRSL